MISNESTVKTFLGNTPPIHTLESAVPLKDIMFIIRFLKAVAITTDVDKEYIRKMEFEYVNIISYIKTVLLTDT